MILNIFWGDGWIRLRNNREAREGGAMIGHGKRRMMDATIDRRQAIERAVTLCGLACIGSPVIAAQEMKKAPVKSPNARRTSLHQEVDLPVAPDHIYHLLLDSKEFTDLTGMPAEIDPVAGGAFSLFGKIIYGRNIELIPNQLVIQAWGDKGWGAGVYSIAHFELRKQGSATRVVLDHTGFPEGNYDHLYDGWKGHYWDPMRKRFAEAR